MVEFGLKLDDNKVEEWSDKYIDYEALKKLIKKAKKASAIRAALEKKDPAAAIELKEKYDNERQQKSATDSNSALNKISEHSTPFEDESLGEVSNRGENVLLLSSQSLDEISMSKYGSNGSLNRSKYGSNESVSSLGSFFKGVKRGFPFPGFENRLLDALQSESLAIDSFSIAIYREVSYGCIMVQNAFKNENCVHPISLYTDDLFILVYVM